MNNDNQLSTVQSTELAIVQPSSVEMIERATVDLQIATAHRFPRSMVQFQSRARAMALIDEETASSCIYSRPVGGGKFAEGLSVRAAEIVAASYGNIRVGATVIEQTERFVKARGFAHDLESNYAVATEVIESTVKRDGSPYDERMRIVIAKSALAKARRDATFQVVPKALFRKIEMECKKVALGEGMTITQRRVRISQWIKVLGIDPKRVWKVLEIQGEEDLQDDHFITLTGLKTAISDGEVTIDEAFPTFIPAGKVASTILGGAKKEKSVAPADPAPGAEPEPKPTEPTPAPDAPGEPSPADDKDGPAPAALVKQLTQACSKAGVTKGLMMEYLTKSQFVPSGTEFDALTATQITAILEVWADVVAGTKAL